MYARYAELLEEKGVSNYRVSKETGIATATLSDWKNGKSTPKTNKMQLIADYFDVSLDYLTGKSEYRNQAAILKELDRIQQDDEIQTIAAHHEGEQWTDEELEEIRRFMDFVKAKRVNK